jgi:Uma2 family endonuclease
MISVEEYLSTSYEGGAEYVDGEVFERNWGERTHSEMQGELLFFLHLRRAELGLFVLPSLTLRVSAARFRIPDVGAYLEEPEEQIPRTPPFLCIEVLSPEDRCIRFQEKIDDYLNFGVPYVWVINPWSRRAWTYNKEGSSEVKDGILRTGNPSLTVLLPEIFAAIDAQ